MKNTEDPRIKKFAQVLVEHSCDIEKGDNVYLLGTSLECLPLFREVRRQIIKKGAYPNEHLLYDSQIGSSCMDYDWLKHASKEQLENSSEAKLKEMKEMDAFIRIGGYENCRELSDIDSEKISATSRSSEKIREARFDLNWVATRYPTTGMAQSAEISNQELEDIIFDSVTYTDWEEQKKKNQGIKKIFDEAEKVRITGKDTDLEMSLEGREGTSSHGKRNIPDGEVFYAPKKESLEGEIYFNYPGVENGNRVEDIRLKFKEGKIVEFSASKNEDFLKSMINTDEGSQYIGEFGIGTNRNRKKFVGEAILDEKIGGSIHLAIGRAYKLSFEEEDPDERNRSTVHWDIVKDLKPEFGGGKIIADGEVVQSDGEWVF